jgi:GT2 family glycosyltransferase/uncharacterized coiled-coil protein SlyX
MVKDKKKRKLVFVLGLFQSGASIFGNSLSKLKFDLGKSNIEVPEYKAYSNKKLAEFNKKLLEDFNINWKDGFFDVWSEIEPEDSSEYQEEFELILESEFDEDSDIVIYDPRTTFLLPIWKKIIPVIKFDISYIIFTNTPQSNVESLYYIRSLDHRQALLIWLNAYFSAEFYTRGENRTFIYADSFFSNPYDGIIQLAKDYKLNFSSKNTRLKGYFKRLYNHESDYLSDHQIVLQGHTKDYSTKLYKILSKNQLDSDEKLETKLNSLRDNFSSDAKSFLFKTYSGTNVSLRVVFKFADGETDTQLVDVSKGLNDINLMSSSTGECTEILLYPSATFSIVKVDYISINEGDNFTINKSNLLFEHGINYLVDSDSYLRITPDEPKDRINLSLKVDFIEYGERVLKYLPKLQSKVNEWIAANNNKYQNKIDLLESEALDYEKTIKELSDHLVKHEQLIERLKDLQKYKDKWDELMVDVPEIGNVDDYIENIISESNRKSTENEQLRNRIAQLHGTLQEKDKRLEEMKSSEFEIKLAKVSTQLSFTEENKKQLEEQLKDQEKQIAKLNSELQKMNDALQKKEKEALKKDDKASEIEMFKLTFKLEHQESENQQLEKQLKKHEKEIKELGKKIKSRNSKIEELKEKLLTKQFENERLSYQVKLNFEKIDELNERIQILSEENDAIVKESFYFLEENNQALSQIQHKYLEESKATVQTIEEKEKALRELNSKLSGYQQKIDLLNAEKNELESRGLNDNQELKQLFEEKENTITELYRDLEDLREQHRVLEYELNNRERENQELKDSVSFQLGKGLTSPLRWVYDKSTGNKPINQSKLWLLKQMFRSGIKNPGKAVKNLNPQNIKTLHKALKNEPPQVIAANLNKLIEEDDNDLGVDMPPVERNKQKVLFISPNLPDFDTSSGGKRATRMLELLAQEFQVYAFTLGDQPQKYIDKLNEIGVVVLRTRNYYRIKKKISHFNAIIFAWYYTYFDAHKFVELYPSARIILDSVDVHWVREERSLGIWEGLTEADVHKNKKRELKAYGQADIIWAVTENDKNNILNELPTADVRVVSNIHEVHKHEYVDSGNNKMLFFGGFNHYPNISAVKMIVSDLLPLVRKEINDATIIIAGANAPEEVQELGKIEGVEYKGFIEESELDNLYEESLLAVAPLLAGAGIKGKICEAIAYRTPVFTNSIGNEGIDLVSEESGFISDNMPTLANYIVKAMKREYNMAEITERAQNILSGIVGPEGVKKNMVGSIMPQVSICIVTWNRLDLVKRCIESIEGNTDYPNYKILVHSNGCTDGTQDYLKAAAEINKKIVPILSKDNEVFVKPNNAMMQMFPNNDAVLVNNDVYVTKGWLTALVNAAYSDTEIGIAGSKILYPDNTLQEFGSELYADGTGRNIGKWDDPNKDDYKYMKRVGYVSGCSMYIKRSTIDQIGVFDERFHPCYCEDSDLCYTAWENDIQTIVTPQSIIYHDEGGTSGTDEESGFKAYQKVNFEKFLEKHRDNLSAIQNRIESLN